MIADEVRRRVQSLIGAAEPRVGPLLTAALLWTSACASPPPDLAGAVVAVEDQSTDETVNLPAWPVERMYGAATADLAAWLLPGDAPPPVRHSVSNFLPPGDGHSVTLFGRGRLLAAGVCKREAWTINLSPEPPELDARPFVRLRYPLYSIDAGAGCADPKGGVSATSDVEAITLLRRFAAVRRSVLGGAGRVRCIEIERDCKALWSSLTPATLGSASRCFERRGCAQYQFGDTIIVQVTGPERRPRIEIVQVPAPVY